MALLTHRLGSVPRRSSRFLSRRPGGCITAAIATLVSKEGESPAPKTREARCCLANQLQMFIKPLAACLGKNCTPKTPGTDALPKHRVQMPQRRQPTKMAQCSAMAWQGNNQSAPPHMDTHRLATTATVCAHASAAAAGSSNHHHWPPSREIRVKRAHGCGGTSISAQLRAHAPALEQRLQDQNLEHSSPPLQRSRHHLTVLAGGMTAPLAGAASAGINALPWLNPKPQHPKT